MSTSKDDESPAEPKPDPDLTTRKVGLSLKRGVEYCGKHPFATGLFALVGVVGLLISVYGFTLDRQEASDTSQQVVSLEDDVEALADNVTSLDPNVRDAAINVPVRIDFGRWGDEIDTVIFEDQIIDPDIKLSGPAASAEMNRIYNEHDAYSSSPFFNFSVSSVADKNFVQVAPYLLVDVVKASPLPKNLAAMYLGQRGGAAEIREFRGVLVPAEGIQVVPLRQRPNSQRVDFLTLQPGEVEEVHLELSYYPDTAFEFRLGVQTKFMGAPVIVWSDRVHRRANVVGDLPTITWQEEAFKVMAFPDGESVSRDGLIALHQAGVETYNGSRLFKLEDAALQLAEYSD